MIKKILCILTAFACALCLAACAGGRSGEAQQTPVVTPVVTPQGTAANADLGTPDPEGDTNVTVPAEEGAEALAEAGDTVLLKFTGLKEAGLTAAEIAEMELYEYTETISSETPVFCGPLLNDVLARIGASGAKSFKIVLGGGQAERSFDIAELDPETAMLAVLKNGRVQGGETCTLICVTLDGFSYMLDVNGAIVLE